MPSVHFDHVSKRFGGTTVVEDFSLDRMQQIGRQDLEERMKAYRQMLSF